MVRILSVFIVTAALTAAAQVSDNTTATAAGITPANGVTAGEIALSGSGTPVGAPLQQGANQANNGGTGYVWNPPATLNAVNNTLATPVSDNANPATNTAGGNSAGHGVNLGIRTFESGAPAGSTKPSRSLAEIASQYASRRAEQHTKEYSNDDLAALKNGAKISDVGRPINENFTLAQKQSDVLPASDQGDQPQFAAAEQPVKSRADLAAVNAAIARHQNIPDSMNENASATTPSTQPAEQEEQMAQNEGAQQLPQGDQAGDQGADASANQNQAGNIQGGQATAGAKSLPASATSLPLFLLLGVGALGVGAAWKFRS